ncbi:MAG: ArsR family transcriptional regulator [Janthinobacterium lividum]
MNKETHSRPTLADFAIFDDRASNGMAVAQAIDNGQSIPYSTTIRTHKLENFLTSLTPKRFQLLRLSRSGKHSISELALAAQRDPSSVSKDISKLVELGLVNVVTEINAGHGVKKIVRPVAENIEISAALF